MFSRIWLLLSISHLCLSSPFSTPTLQTLQSHHNHSLQASPTHTQLSEPARPTCFIFRFAPVLRAQQCNAQLEWFLDEVRKYDLLDFSGREMPRAFSRATHNCFVTITAEDPTDADSFTYGDLARFTSTILDQCRGGRFISGRGGEMEMTDASGSWGGFVLRVDAFSPLHREQNDNGTLRIGNKTLPFLGATY